MEGGWKMKVSIPLDFGIQGLWGFTGYLGLT